MSYFPVLWLSRLSMILSLARMLPPGFRARKIPYILGIIFFLLGIILSLQTVIVCTKDESWHHLPAVQCTGTSWISSFTCDILADVLLTILPIHFLWRAQLPKSQRRLVFTVFGCSLISCIMTTLVYVFLLGPTTWGPQKGHIVIYMSQLQAIFQFVVANMLIIVALVYRRIKGKEEEEGGGDATDYFEITTIHRRTTMDPESPPDGSTEKL